MTSIAYGLSIYFPTRDVVDPQFEIAGTRVAERRDGSVVVTFSSVTTITAHSEQALSEQLNAHDSAALDTLTRVGISGQLLARIGAIVNVRLSLRPTLREMSIELPVSSVRGWRRLGADLYINAYVGGAEVDHPGPDEVTLFENGLGAQGGSTVVTKNSEERVEHFEHAVRRIARSTTKESALGIELRPRSGTAGIVISHEMLALLDGRRILLCSA
ncbi:MULTISPECIES: hypothetical protein [unclassified Leifsonia]|uniref:hypothetical protein n=1 Tax=unclassified Leifsonia TaxID=2663824 RepID=UPI000B21A1CF|nr:MULTISPECIES: hypothetical protein [unclassified Leifsonia]